MSALRTFTGIAVLAVILYSVYVWISRNPPQPAAAPAWPTAQQGTGQPAPGNSITPPGRTANVPGFASAASSPSSPQPSLPGMSVAMSGTPPLASSGSAAPTGPASYPMTNAPDPTRTAINRPGSPGTPAAPASALDSLRGYISRSAAPANPTTPNAAANPSAAGVNPAGAAPGFAAAISAPPASPTVGQPAAATHAGLAGLSTAAGTPAAATIVPAVPATASALPTARTPSATNPAALGTVLTPGAAAPTGILAPTTGTASPSREVAAATATSPATSVSPVTAASATTAIPNDDFRSLMRSIQAKLDAGQLGEAHLALSKFYLHPRLTDDENRQLLGLLDQVAGTVVYSRQHYLEPAYRVQPGDTLERIATIYNVSAELLAKINGIRDPQNLAPGMELKVVRGPFDAVVDVNRYQLIVLLQDRYAGRFPIGIGRDQPLADGSFIVRDKKANPTYYGADRVIAAGDPANPYGDRMLDLGGRLAIHGTDNAQSIGRSDGRGAISLGARDIHDVYDILSVGSRVTIRR